jgi:hypothetical protein
MAEKLKDEVFQQHVKGGRLDKKSLGCLGVF